MYALSFKLSICAASNGPYAGALHFQQEIWHHPVPAPLHHKGAARSGNGTLLAYVYRLGTLPLIAWRLLRLLI